MKRYGNKIFVTIMSHKFKVESYSGHFETLNVLKHFLEFEEISKCIVSHQGCRGKAFSTLKS